MNKLLAAAIIACALTSCAESHSPAASTTAQAATSSTALAGKLAEDFKTNFGATTWGMTVSQVLVDGSNAHFRAQINPTDKDIAEEIQRGAVNLVSTSSEYSGIVWVIVEDGSGVVITQQPVR